MILLNIMQHNGVFYIPVGALRHPCQRWRHQWASVLQTAMATCYATDPQCGGRCQPSNLRSRCPSGRVAKVARACLLRSESLERNVIGYVHPSMPHWMRV